MGLVERHPAITVLREQVRQVRHELRLCARSRRWTPRSVHRARVATRRCRAALDVLKSAGDARRVRSARKPIKRLARALGAVRAIDVSTLLLVHLADASDLTRLSAPLLRHLRSERRRLAGQLAMVAAHRDVAEALDCAGWLEVARTETHRPSAVDRRVAVMEMWLQRCRRRPTKAGLHRLRIVTKRLRYVLEVVYRGDAAAEQRLEPLRRLQEALGALHDCEVARRGVQTFQRDVGRSAALQQLTRAAAERERTLRLDARVLVRETVERASALKGLGASVFLNAGAYAHKHSRTHLRSSGG